MVKRSSRRRKGSSSNRSSKSSSTRTSNCATGQLDRPESRHRRPPFRLPRIRPTARPEERSSIQKEGAEELAIVGYIRYYHDE